MTKRIEKADRSELEVIILKYQIVDVDDSMVLDRLANMKTENMRDLVRSWDSVNIEKEKSSMTFSIEKMEEFKKQDLLINKMVDQTVKNGIEYNKALEIVFNSEILNDGLMMGIYETL